MKKTTKEHSYYRNYTETFNSNRYTLQRLIDAFGSRTKQNLSLENKLCIEAYKDSLMNKEKLNTEQVTKLFFPSAQPKKKVV